MTDATDRFNDETAINDAATDEAVFRLLAAFYNINPDMNLVKAVLKLTPEQISDAEIGKCITMIRDFASKVDEDESLLIELKRDWTKLFRGVAPDYGPKPPYEQLYVGSKGLEVISELADVYFANNYFEFFEINNRHDYIGTELAFVAYLSSLRRIAAESGNVTEYLRLSGLSEDFIRYHICHWAERFCEEAFKHCSTDFYRGVMHLTLSLINTKGGFCDGIS
ncbi:MAG: molecular chaperone [Deferribacterales bacterium]